jgi:hypothetical protein
MRFFGQFSDHVKHETITKLVTPSALKHSLPKFSDFHTSLVLSIDSSMPIE